MEQRYLDFKKSIQKSISQIESLRDEVIADRELSERIRHKYSIKNVTGLNILPLITFTDPIDILLHCQFWAIRSGIFPTVGGMRRPGTTCLIEDVAFHIEDLADAVTDLSDVLDKYGYDDSCIYGHALEGNFHFIINQSFSSEKGIKVGYSNSRTCEIGLQTNSGVPYRSIIYLVNQCTSAK